MLRLSWLKSSNLVFCIIISNTNLFAQKLQLQVGFEQFSNKIGRDKTQGSSFKYQNKMLKEEPLINFGVDYISNNNIKYSISSGYTKGTYHTENKYNNLALYPINGFYDYTKQQHQIKLYFISLSISKVLKYNNLIFNIGIKNSTSYKNHSYNYTRYASDDTLLDFRRFYNDISISPITLTNNISFLSAFCFKITKKINLGIELLTGIQYERKKGTEFNTFITSDLINNTSSTNYINIYTNEHRLYFKIRGMAFVTYQLYAKKKKHEKK